MGSRKYSSSQYIAYQKKTSEENFETVRTRYRTLKTTHEKWVILKAKVLLIVFSSNFDRYKDRLNHRFKVPLTRYSKVSPNCSQDSSGLSTTRDLDETRHLFRGLTATSEKTLRFNSRYAQILSRWEQSVKKTTEGERGGPWEDPRTKEGDVCIFAEKKNTTTLPFFSEWYK